jgi:hypothetical protein
MTTYYKIRNRATGLFSRGGQTVEWNRSGKVWTTLGTLRNHLAQHMPTRYRDGTNMTDWEVVEYEVREVGTKNIHETLSQEQLVKLIRRA